MDLEPLTRVFEQAYGNTHSDFYRALYAARDFSPPQHFPGSLADWVKLPLLSKEDLAAVPVERRTFIPKEEVLFYRTSSGTTNRGVIITPRNYVPDRSKQAKYTKRVLEFLTPHHVVNVGAERAGIEMIEGDTSDLLATAKLASKFHIDGISSPASVLAALITELAEFMDMSDIQYVLLWGERLSVAKRALFFTSFPNAHIEGDYGLSELHGVGGICCEEMMRAREIYVHPRNDVMYWELIDPSSGGSVSDQGEIVLTTLWSNNAFPALRYRTGDLARRVDFPCACGLPSYEILGRAAHDRAVIAGGLITSIELERALWPYHDHIEDDFELHIHEDIGLLPRFELLIRPKTDSTLDPEAIAKNVSQSLMISPQRTLDDAIRGGFAANMKCVLLPPGIVMPKKQLRIFTH